MKEQRGLVIRDQFSFGDVARFQAGLPEWLIERLTKYLHIRQANWRPSRLGQMTYQFWAKSTRIWRWLFADLEIRAVEEITRDYLFTYIDEQLVAGYKVATINLHLPFRGRCAFCSSRGWRCQMRC